MLKMEALQTLSSEARSATDPTLIGRPFSVFNIELTNRCPFKCVMCARTNNMTRLQGVMDFALFRKIIDEYVDANPKRAASSECWLHHFGESLVHPDFDRFIAYASARGVFTALSLNPLLLKRPLALALLRADPGKLYFSLDGHDDASFEKIRGVKDAYEPSVRNLLNFLALKKSFGSKVKVFVSMIHFGLNEGSIDRMREYWSNMDGVDHFLDKEFITWDGNAQDVNKLEGYSPIPQKDHVTCQFPWDKMTVTWDGDVVPCCYDYDKRYVLGNALRQSLSEIWNGEPMRRLRQEFLDNQVDNPLCRNCEYLRG
ncbi:radical SAM protein with 4Fe4S-binding SPASM domain [Azospirillum agricola]|uniref:radical SAM/SPASM domain-containing protein n=1 Tax=Azospirillum agricola TaxID=1720247 RepID=UPI001AE9EFE3|nr:radical SAM/SPASM domain-containing protein [Azospirillum agricola]MBP2233372.1 radical SAM protein with 4Fe4S-binding SPASM domain [Azospirillum agricola]